LPVRIKLTDKEYELKYQEELICSEETINDDLMAQAGLYAWYAVLSEMAADEMANRKLDLEVLEGQLFASYKSGADKVTDKGADSQVKQDESYITAVVKLNEAKKYVGILKGIKEAFSHRKDMLWSLAANVRAQSDSHVLLKKQEAKEKI